MLNSRELFKRRTRRTRHALLSKTKRPRLSVFRSSKHIYAQIIDDANGRTLVAASSMDKDLKGKLKTGADRDAAAEVGKLVADARQGERGGESGVRPWRLSVPRAGEGAGRCRARSRIAILKGPKMARRPRQREEGQDTDLVDKLVSINRVAKVVKGGRRFGFAALVVVGDTKGRVGYGAGKAREVPEAIRKATEQAKRKMIRVPIRDGRTLHHDVEGRFGAGRVILRAAPAGTGIIAGGPMRAIFETVGVHDIVTKSVGTSNPYNMIKATFAALQNLSSPRSVAARRSKKVSDLFGRGSKAEAQAQEA